MARSYLPPSMEDISPPSMEDLRPANSSRSTPSVENLSAQATSSGYADLSVSAKPSVEDIRRLFHKKKGNVEQSGAANQPAVPPSRSTGSQDARMTSEIDWICTTIGGLQKELENQRQEFMLQLDHLRRELHSEVDSVKTASASGKQELSHLQGNMQSIANKLCEVQTSSKGSSSTQELEIATIQMASKFELFDSRLCKLENSISINSKDIGHDAQNRAPIHSKPAPQHYGQASAMSQSLPAMPGMDQSAHDALLQQLRLDASIIPDSILEPTDSIRRQCGGALRMGSLPLETLEQHGDARPGSVDKPHRSSAPPEVLSQAKPTDALSSLQLNDVARLPARSSSPRQVWASDLPPSPRRSPRSLSPRSDPLINTV